MKDYYFTVDNETATWTCKDTEVYFSLAKGVDLKEKFPQVKKVIIPNRLYEALYNDLTSLRNYTDNYKTSREDFFDGMGWLFRDLNRSTMRVENLFLVMPEAYTNK